MRILFLCHRIPYPPNKGDKLRAFNILKFLSRKHTIDLFALADDRNDLKYQKDLKSLCRKVEILYLNPLMARLKSLLHFFSSEPLTLSYFQHSELKKKVEQALATERYDLIFLYSSSMAQYVLDLDGTPPKIIDFVDADSIKWLDYAKFAKFPMSMVYRSEGEKLGAYEAKVAPHFQRILMVSEGEKERGERYVKADNVVAVRNGIDLSLYEEVPVCRAENKDLLFIGGMFYFAYIDGIFYFYKNIFPHIKRASPDTCFYVVGASPARKIRKLNKDPNMRVTGFVPDVKPYLRKAAVYVVPLRMAPGIQNKILEAMAMKVPVVATPEAAAGINAVAGRDLFVEEDPAKFASRVVELLKNTDLRRQMADNARKLIEKEYNWEKNLSRLDDILGDI